MSPTDYIIRLKTVSFVMNTGIHINDLKSIKQFFIGVKNEFLLLDKNKTKIQLKSIARIITIVTKSKKKVLFISQNDIYKKEVSDFAKQKNQLYSD